MVNRFSKAFIYKKFILLIILALIFNNLYLLHQRGIMRSELQSSIENEGRRIIGTLQTMRWDSFLYMMELSEGEIDDDFFLQAEERIYKNIALADNFNLSSVQYIYESMAELFVLYRYENSLTQQELLYLLEGLHYDLGEFILIFLDLDKYYAKPVEINGPWSTDNQLAYNRANGLDTDFHKIEKEYMNALVKKYFNLTTDDVAAAHANKIRR